MNNRGDDPRLRRTGRDNWAAFLAMGYSASPSTTCPPSVKRVPRPERLQKRPGSS